MAAMKYSVLIRRVEDGAERWFSPRWAADDAFTMNYMWEEGNYGCDCNRARFFAKAAGEDYCDITCGTGKYEIVAIKRDDGAYLGIDGATGEPVWSK